MANRSGKVLLIADTHFGHARIIDYADRPFDSVDEMNEMLIQRWNNVVGTNDTIFFLGDFGIGSRERIASWLSRLQGHKVLIMGNHDRQSSSEWWRTAGFQEVSAHPIIYAEWYMLSHEPLYITKSMPYANIFGHVHSNPMYRDCSEQSFCVSAERIQYTPIEFHEILMRMKACSGATAEIEECMRE